MTKFNPTVGPNRVCLSSSSEMSDDEKKGLLVVDGRRARSHYFDGRFLAARDLTREQNYFLVRQADLAQAGGVGVIRGLHVQKIGARELRVAAGQGTTSAGEIVTLTRPTQLSLDHVESIHRIDASLGLATVPENDPARKTKRSLCACSSSD